MVHLHAVLLTPAATALLSPALIQFINSSRNGMRPSAVRMTCHASRFGGLSSIDYSRGRDGVCPEQGSISTGTKDSQMGSLECGRMEHSIVDCRCLAYWASYQRAWVALPCLAWLSLDIDRSWVLDRWGKMLPGWQCTKLGEINKHAEQVHVLFVVLLLSCKTQISTVQSLVETCTGLSGKWVAKKESAGLYSFRRPVSLRVSLPLSHFKEQLWSICR